MSCHIKFTGPDLSITAEAEQEQASITCVRCQSQNIIKFGVRNNQQRYHCQICNYKFIALDVAAITKPAPTPDTPTCKRCKTGLTIKFGIIRKTQRYYCKKCDYEFIIVNDQEQEVQKKKEPLLQKIRKKWASLAITCWIKVLISQPTGS